MSRLAYLFLISTLLCVMSEPMYGQRNRGGVGKSYAKKRLKKSYNRKKRSSKKIRGHFDRGTEKVLKRNKGVNPKDQYLLSKAEHYVSVGANIGTMNYKGEFDQSRTLISSNLKKTRPSFGITVTERITYHLSYRATLSYGRIAGTDADAKIKAGASQEVLESAVFRRARNLSFTNDIFELKVDAIYDILGAKGKGYRKRRLLTPYIFAGVSVFTNNPKADGKNLRKIGTSGQTLTGSDRENLQAIYDGLADEYDFDPKVPEPYSPIQVAIPFGIGLRKRLSPHFDLSFEIGARFTFTDYLDDIADNTLYVGRQYAQSIGRDDIAQFNDGFSLDDAQLVSDLGDLISLIDTGPNGFATTGEPRGTSAKSTFLSRRDYYIFTGFSVTYIIGKSFVRSKF